MGDVMYRYVSVSKAYICMYLHIVYILGSLLQRIAGKSEAALIARSLASKPERSYRLSTITSPAP